MTPGAFALQVLAIGGQQVWHVAWVTLMWAVLAAALTVVLWPGRWVRERRVTHLVFGALPPLIADAPEGHGCDWCDDRLPAGKCDCTGDCGRWCCMAGSAVTARKAHAAFEAEVDEMVRRYGNGA